jgi:dUTP pyrophosphatase
MNKMNDGHGDLKFSPIDPSEYWVIPHKHYPGDAGHDLAASRQVTVPPKSFASIPTNLAIAPPPGAWALLIGRSSTFVRKGLYVNPGIIDNGYRGELMAAVYNMTDSPVTVRKGERISQVIILPQHAAEVVLVDHIPAGDRGQSGFGSTGE